jgi:hypothetical protein
MPRIMYAPVGLSAVTLALVLSAGAASATPAATSALAARSLVPEAGATPVGYRRYRDYDDDYYENVPPSYYAPRVYGYVQRYGYGPPPPAVYPPLYFYDWGPPPRPTSCGKYRYWNGEFCADARFRPPYVGPRW